MRSILIQSALRNYEVEFSGTAALKKFIMQGIESDFVFVVDEIVWGFYSANLLSKVDVEKLIIIRSSEENKSYQAVFSLYDRFLKYSVKRNSTVVAIGGGVLQDLVGFACSTFYRGINWVFVPTTSLSQLDSCIGGKTSLNYEGYKNILGTFYPPIKIIIYPKFLNTLGDDIYYSGLGEAAKLHLIGGNDLAERFRKSIGKLKMRHMPTIEKVIVDSLVIKQKFIVEDEFDDGRRHMLNYGHCFGHAIEASTNFSISHGQAVVLGIFMANCISVRRNLLAEEVHNKISELILSRIYVSGMDFNLIDQTKLIEALKKDKKMIGNNLAILLLANNFEITQYNDLLSVEIDHAISCVNVFLLKSRLSQT